MKLVGFRVSTNNTYQSTQISIYTSHIFSFMRSTKCVPVDKTLFASAVSVYLVNTRPFQRSMWRGIRNNDSSLCSHHVSGVKRW